MLGYFVLGVCVHAILRCCLIHQNILYHTNMVYTKDV